MEEPTRNSTFKGPSGEARRDNEYQVREKGISWKLREEHASERMEWSAVSCVSEVTVSRSDDWFWEMDFTGHCITHGLKALVVTQASWEWIDERVGGDSYYRTFAMKIRVLSTLCA